MLIDLIEAIFCELAIDEERSYVLRRGWMTRAENVRIAANEII